MYLIDRQSAAITIQKIFGGRARSMYMQQVSQVEKAAHPLRDNELSSDEVSHSDPVTAAITIQKFFRGRRARLLYMQQVRQLEKIAYSLRANELDYSYEKAALLIQRTFRQFITRTLWLQNSASIKIQCSYRGWQSRKKFIDLKLAVLRIQSILRCIKCQRLFQIYIQETKSAIVIQAYIRGRIARQAAIRERDARELSMCMEAITVIHSSFICMKFRKTYLSCRQAAIQIQAIVRGEITRKRILGASSFSKALTNRLPNEELNIFIDCVLKLQRWWRGILSIKMKTKSAILVQSNVRGWLARRRATRESVCIVVIQTYWRGYIARRNSKVQLVDLRQRVKISAKNVDDNRRLINRLIAAVSELLNMRSVSGILHTCQTLDMATELSQKCCDELVAAGAIDTLLTLIRSVSRSIPDQEILKHSLSTLINLARYPHLIEVLIDTRGLLETVLLEITRNREEGYFIAAQLLKKICRHEKGMRVVHRLPAHVKRLHNLVEELSRKAAALEKRNTRGGNGSREQIDRRLKEATELWGLIMTRKASH